MNIHSIARRIISGLIPGKVLTYTRKKRFSEDRIIYKGMSFREFKDAAFADFASVLPAAERQRISLDMIDAFLRYHVRPDEYFLYHFDKIADARRSDYLPQMAKDMMMSRYYGSKSAEIIGFMRNKSVFYDAMKPFFRRDAISVASMDDLRLFSSFCEKHPVFIAKDDSGGCGVGIRVISVGEHEDMSGLLEEITSSGRKIIEEIITQDPSIAAFNTSSVNTVRFPSFRHGNQVEQVFPCMRFGRSGNIVDNAGQGGVFVSIDIDSGEIITDAFDEHGHRYEAHPDTGMVFKGFVIPGWHELREIAKAAHLAMPEEQVYVAFDFALSDKGWVIVEGNWGDWILQQVSLERGMKNEFYSLLYGNNS